MEMREMDGTAQGRQPWALGMLVAARDTDALPFAKQTKTNTRAYLNTASSAGRKLFFLQCHSHLCFRVTCLPYFQWEMQALAGMQSNAR